jgi:glycosyltransferase involved in cell wall biosynthesis
MIQTKDIYVLIPSLNEHHHLYHVIEGVLKYFPASQVVVIDDGSTPPLRKVKTVNWLRHSNNQGKGAAMITGAEFAFAHKSKAIIFMDSDGQHDPKHLPEFISKIQSGYDVVLGSRQTGVDVPLMRFLSKKFASVYLNLLFGIYVQDVLSGYRALTLRAYHSLKWSSQRYEVEAEMIYKLGNNRHSLRYIEIPINTIYHQSVQAMNLVDTYHLFIKSLTWKFFSN